MLDVMVVECGLIGCASAIAAALVRAKILLLESTGCIGGTTTSALLPA